MMGPAPDSKVVGCCGIRTYSATPSRIEPPIPGKPRCIVSAILVSSTDRPRGLLPNTTTVDVEHSALRGSIAVWICSAHTHTRTRSYRLPLPSATTRTELFCTAVPLKFRATSPRLMISFVLAP
jgi:hypothetical protein